MGYNSYWKVLNAKDYGIPQNRERVFIISIRKDIDDGKFKFPEPFDNGLRLKDMLDDKVDEKYYINNPKIDKLLNQLKKKEIGNSIRVGSRGSIDRHQRDLVAEQAMSIGNTNPSGRGINGNVYNSNNISPTLTTNKGEGIKIICAQRGRYNQDGSTQQQLEIQKEEVSNTLTSVQKDNLLLEQVICEQRTDEGLRFFKDNVCGTIRTIDSGGDKRVIEKTNKLLVVGNTVPSEHTAGRVFDTEGISPTVMYRNSKVIQVLEEKAETSDVAKKESEPDNELQFVGGIGDKDWVGDGKELSRNYPQGNRVYHSEGVAVSQTAQGGGIGGVTGLYLVDKPNELQLFTNLEGGKWDKATDQIKRVYSEEGISPTVSTCQGGHREPKVHTNYRIRKLTPLECWRLMGFTDEDYWNARKALETEYYNGRDRSNSQMYKMAGNSIVVDVLEHIFKNLFNT